MSASNQANNPDAGWEPSARPQSTLARDFSAVLDDLFNLNGIGELEQAVFQKKDTVQSQKYQLEDLDAKLREADARLKQLESKHPQQQANTMTSMPQRRKPVPSIPAADRDAEDSGGDSDAHIRSSPQQRQ